jgi:hypothetical protein
MKLTDSDDSTFGIGPDLQANESGDQPAVASGVQAADWYVAERQHPTLKAPIKG